MNKPGINRSLSVFTIILLLANIVSLILLWSTKNGRRDKPLPASDFISNELRLNQQQQNAYKKLVDEHRMTQEQLQDSIRQSKDDFFELLKEKNIPDSILDQKNKKANAFEQQRDMITFRHFQKLRGLCDPAQQKKFDGIIKEVLHNMGGPKPPPAGPRQPPPSP